MLTKITNLDEYETLKFIVDTIDALIYVIDIENYQTLYANKTCIEEFGDVIGQTCFLALQKDTNEPCKECPLYNNKFLKDIRSTHKWEHTNTINNKTYLFSNKTIEINNKLLNLQIGIDITAQKKLEKEIQYKLTDNIKTFEAFVNSTIEGLIIFDENKKCYKTNKIAPKILGYEYDDMIGRSAMEFVSKDSLNLVKQKIQVNDQEPYEAILIKKDGSKFPAILRGKDINLNGKKLRVSAILDITDLKEKEKEIANLAYYDSLTSLPNRILLKDRMHQIILQKERTNEFGALMFIDLDHFKTINDTKGHMIGDKILVDCAHRLKTTIRNYDTIARFGGDEFVVIIDTRKRNKEEAIGIFSQIAKKILTTIKTPFLIEDNQFQLSASIGISIFNSKVSFNELLKQADSAMYNSKYGGKDKFSFFDPKLQQEMERKAVVLDRLRSAVYSESLEIYYQKQVDINAQTIGVEALARWNDEVLGFVSPAEFIPVAEESGLIIPFGHFLIRKVIKLLNSWKDDEEKSKWRISINISLKQFEKDDCELMIQNILQKYDIPKNRLRIEITESVLLKNTQNALKKIHFLKNLGVSISIDDFGTGYSSLSYLKKLPIDELKIDKSFIDDILTDENDETIVNAIISIGKKFGFELIAEGVETKEVFEKLKELGCENFQGYYFAKPVPLEEID
jgi:diguanylate cyclase (GGDEF)-like protein/PAS domain S-box-containing protein